MDKLLHIIESLFRQHHFYVLFVLFAEMILFGCRISPGFRGGILSLLAYLYVGLKLVSPGIEPLPRSKQMTPAAA